MRLLMGECTWGECTDSIALVSVDHHNMMGTASWRRSKNHTPNRYKVWTFKLVGTHFNEWSDELENLSALKSCSVSLTKFWHLSDTCLPTVWHLTTSTNNCLTPTTHVSDNCYPSPHSMTYNKLYSYLPVNPTMTYLNCGGRLVNKSSRQYYDTKNGG